MSESCPRELSRPIETSGRSLRCGRVDVSASRTQLHREQVFFVEISCPQTDQGSSGSCGAEPLVVFAGGPGDALTPELPQRLEYWLPRAPDRSLVFIDARGTGNSRPALLCRRALHSADDLERCFLRWDQEIDLDSYGTDTHVRDAAVVLDALEIDQVVVYGVSYGTHLATEFARASPDRVRALILDSPLPPGMDVLAPIGKNASQALGDVFMDCREQGVCGKDSSLEQLAALAQRLDRAQEQGRASGAPAGTRFVAALARFVHAPSVVPYLPFLVSQAQKGDFRLFWRLQEPPANLAAFSWGMHLSVQCKERFPWTSAKNMSLLDAEVLPGLVEALSGKHYLEYCRVWRVTPRRVQAISEPISTKTLIVSGQYDSVTPFDYAEHLSKSFEDVRLVKIPHVGHGAVLTDCGKRVMLSFLGELEKIPGWSCEDDFRFMMQEPEERIVAQMRSDLYFRL